MHLSNDFDGLIHWKKKENYLIVINNIICYVVYDGKVFGSTISIVRERDRGIMRLKAEVWFEKIYLYKRLKFF